MKTHVILSHATGELLQVAIERAADSEKASRSGIVFRTMTGKAFFLSFTEFSFFIPCQPSLSSAA